MGHRWLDDSELVRVFLDVEDRACRHCGAKMHVCDHRRHRIETLEGQRKIVCRLVKCIDRTCPANHRTVSPEAEAALCLPRSIFGWDVFCWIGHRRFSRHWSVPQIRGELQDSYQIRVSDDAIEDVIARYQAIVEADSHAKVRMLSKVRGLRAIEKDLLAAQRAEELRTQTDGIPSEDRPSEPIAAAATNTNTPATLSSANAVVLDYCTAVKGILNDDQGGPLHPPGIRMVEALQSVRESLERCLATKKGDAENALKRLAGCIDRGLDCVAEERPLIRGHVEVVRSIAATLDPTQGNCEFRHAGVRIVLEGPSMIHALDLHQRHPEPLTSTDLLPFRDATPHISQLQSLQRRSLMRRARSTKKRPRLLAELESRYKDSS